ncbi:F-box domain-containing protein [Artemisia annua]|uniref:F-box domain-containing protein n=1 Tax=Artemisia annua TaxID=35608 RepID=A0A2U1KQ88_ARTAN|nr:F-box domain-containing protein [Artemisia annua]
MADLNFPEEILNNVVVWLPTKSLFRFKCVSKHWNTVIPNSFIMKSRPCRRMILLPVQPFHAIDNTVPYNHIDHVIIKRRCSPFGNLEGKRVIVVGTLNGILVLAFRDQFPDHIMLYNPFTEECEKILVPPLCDHTYTYNYGLVYGTALDDLKLFVFRNRLAHHGHDPDDVPGLDAGTFVNGFLYWHVYKRGFGRLILAVDVRYMIVSEIKFPPKRRSKKEIKCSPKRFSKRKKRKRKFHPKFPFPSITLGTLDGCLCMVCSNGSKLEVWPCSVLDEGKIVMLKRLLASNVFYYEIDPFRFVINMFTHVVVQLHYYRRCDSNM